VLDGQVLELATGLRPRPAIVLGSEPAAITLLPGVPQVVRLDLQSHLRQVVDATLSLTPAPGLSADWTEQTVQLPADGAASVMVTLTADTGGVFALPVVVSAVLDGQPTQLPATDLAVFALPLGGVLGGIVDGALRIEHEAMRLTVASEGAALTISDPATGRRLLEHHGYAAPPARPSEFRRGHFELSLTRTADTVVAEAAMASSTYPGLVLRKHITVTAGGVVRLEYELENRAREARCLRLRHVISGDEARAIVTLPLAAGIGRDSWSVFPGPMEEAFARAAAFAEGWAAIEAPEATSGVLWADDVERISWPAVEPCLYDCPPQTRVRPAPLYLSVEQGDWRRVRQRWQRLVGSGAVAAVEAREPLSARIEPPVAVAVDDSASVRLWVEYLAMRSVTGRVALDLPAGWQADTADFITGPVDWQQPFVHEVRLTASLPPGAAVAQIAVRSDDQTVDFPMPLLRLGDGSPVEVRASAVDGQHVLTIANGWLEVDVTPDFGGTVSALREAGVNHLASPFPSVDAIGWMSPWHGGLTPILLPTDDWNQVPGPLWQASFVGEPVECRDGHGIVWRGVRQRATALPEALHGAEVEIETLTVGGSPVVKQLIRLTARAPLRQWPAGFLAFVQPAGERSATTVWGADWQAKPTDQIIWRTAGRWVAAENPATGRVLALVSPLPEAQLAGWGEAGHHLALLVPVTVGSGEVVEITGYLVLADSVAVARPWAALHHLL
jgi:hypothetical protein